MADKIMTYQQMQKMMADILKGLDRTDKALDKNIKETERINRALAETNESIVNGIGKSNGIVAET